MVAKKGCTGTRYGFAAAVLLLVLLVYSIHLDAELMKINQVLQKEGPPSSSAKIPNTTAGECIATPPSSPLDRGWCPLAACRDSLLCHPCRRRFLIIITLGRTASTTLTWMMDLLPGVRMGGENKAIENIQKMINATTSQNFKMKTSQQNRYGAHYHNPKYPWIDGVARYIINGHQGNWNNRGKW